MKCGFFICSAVLVCLTGCGNTEAESRGLPDAAHDLGGTTFDFAAISDKRFRILGPDEKGNLIGKGKWNRRVDLHVRPKDLPGYSEIKKNLAKAVSWQENAGEMTVKLERQTVLSSVGEKYATCASASFVREIPLASTNGGAHAFSMRYRMRHDLGEKGFFIVFYKRRNPKSGVYEIMKNIKQSYSFYDLTILENESAGWNVFSAVYNIPSGAEIAEVYVRIDGAGELSFRDPGIIKVETPAKPWNLVLAPHGWIDGTFALPSGQCAMMMTRWKKNALQCPKAAECTFHLELPKGIRFLAANFADRKRTTCETALDGVQRWEIAFREGYDFSAAWGTDTQPTVLVATDLPPHSVGHGRFCLKSKGQEVSNVVPVEFAVAPRIAVDAPKRMWSVMFPYVGTARFDSEEATRAYAQFMACAGVRWVIPYGYDDKTYQAWRQAGILRITPSSSIANGYHFGSDKGRPENERFVIDPASRSDTWDAYLKRATCPMAVIEKRPFYKEKTLAYLKAHLKGTDGMWANWEPFMFKGRGCNCTNCNEAFEQWRKKTGSSDRSAFRSYLHGKLVLALEEDVRSATGKEKSLGFIPAVTWRSVSSSWRELNPSPESRPQDYCSKLQWINAWGPYVYWVAENPYVYRKRAPLAHFVVARDIRLQIDSDVPDAADRPKLMSMPQGLQCGNWIAQPQWIGMSMDAFTFNGWEANAPGFFPMGYDARYWKEFAQSTERAARYEDFILDGKRVDELVEVKAVDEYACNCGYVSTYLPKYKNVSMLQSVAYEHQGARIVALFNFWEKGEAFFTLRCMGLPPDEYKIVDENSVVYLNNAGRVKRTAEELAQGVFLSVGAARTKVFEIHPAASAIKLSAKMSEKRLKEIYASRRVQLSAAARADAEYEAANAVEQDTKGEL